MNMTKLAATGSMTVHRPKPGVLLSVMKGHISTAQMRDEFDPEWRREFAVAPVRYWISDVLEISRFEPGVLPIAREWGALLKAHGAKAALIVSTSKIVRMASLAAAFAVGIPLNVYATRAEADAVAS